MNPEELNSIATPSNQYVVALNAAALAENLSFSTYALMLEVFLHDEPPSLASVALSTGYSYWGVRNQVERTPWFEKIYGAHLIQLKLTAQGIEKVQRIARRMATFCALIAPQKSQIPVPPDPLGNSFKGIIIKPNPAFSAAIEEARLKSLAIEVQNKKRP